MYPVYWIRKTSVNRHVEIELLQWTIECWNMSIWHRMTFYLNLVHGMENLIKLFFAKINTFRKLVTMIMNSIPLNPDTRTKIGETNPNFLLYRLFMYDIIRWKNCEEEYSTFLLFFKFGGRLFKYKGKKLALLVTIRYCYYYLTNEQNINRFTLN